jgi:putative restriction endonuclease
LSDVDDAAGLFRHDRSDADEAIRAAVFAEVRRLSQIYGNLTSKHLATGIQYKGTRIRFDNPQAGIFKPHQMTRLLSIKTVFVRPGQQATYDDQRNAHQQIYSGDETVEYAFMKKNPDAPANRWLRDAYDLQTPIVYFLGTAPGLYQAILPTFIVDFDPHSLKTKIAFAVSDTATSAPQSSTERRYALRTVKQRLHQASFRELVISAYGGRCAISGLPEPLLLDAAHIVNDGNELYGQPIVTNGIPLSKIHHAAFDQHFIGISPDSIVHVSAKLLAMHDGPTLEVLRQFDGSKLILPRRGIDRPDRDRLAMRFEDFKSAA